MFFIVPEVQAGISANSSCKNAAGASASTEGGEHSDIREGIET